jgi:hypothetical protein
MRKTLLPGAVLLALAGTSALGLASGPLPGAPCEPGYQIVTEVQYREVVKRVCKNVPDVKRVTHWVYECKTVDFCKAGCSLHGARHQGTCDDCDGHGSRCPCGPVGAKHYLLKRLVTEECPTTRCVVECTVERVPCVVCRKVPCAASPAACPAPVPARATLGFQPQGN